ncbi:MAG: Flp pilus assembly protein CpaB [Rhodospirillales bacterium]|nr:Flp pilus assembly protein CpaB [Rhodospirillales bacterium]
MNPRTIILLVVALTAAGMTAFFANTWMAAQRAALEDHGAPAEAPAAIRTVEVLVAKRSLPTGAFIRDGDLAWSAWPEQNVVGEYLVEGKAADTDLVGAVTRTRLFAGEPITRSRVVKKGDQGFLAAVLEPDQRAVSIPVDAVSGISGFIFPGDFVDVLLTFSQTVTDEASDRSSTRYFSRTLLNRVRILAIDQTVENPDGGAAQVAKTATLEVSPKQAEKIAVAQEIGSLSLSLHSIVVEEPEIDTLIRQASLRMPNVVSSAKSAATATGGYTTDIDVLNMIGDPYGLPPPAGFGPRVNVLRGGDARQVRF